jgi:hypothetical protein
VGQVQGEVRQAQEQVRLAERAVAPRPSKRFRNSILVRRFSSWRNSDVGGWRDEPLKRGSFSVWRKRAQVPRSTCAKVTGVTPWSCRLIDGVVGWIEVLVGMGIRRESRLNPQYSTRWLFACWPDRGVRVPMNIRRGTLSKTHHSRLKAVLSVRVYVFFDAFTAFEYFSFFLSARYIHTSCTLWPGQSGKCVGISKARLASRSQKPLHQRYRSTRHDTRPAPALSSPKSPAPFLWNCQPISHPRTVKEISTAKSKTWKAACARATLYIDTLRYYMCVSRHKIPLTGYMCPDECCHTVNQPCGAFLPSFEPTSLSAGANAWRTWKNMPKRLDGMPAWNVPVNPVTSRTENTEALFWATQGEADKRYFEDNNVNKTNPATSVDPVACPAVPEYSSQRSSRNSVYAEGPVTQIEKALTRR